MNTVNLAKSLARVFGTHPENFGTAFQILKDGEFSYFVTSAHVIASIGNQQSITINNQFPAEIIAIGDTRGFDLAVLKVKGSIDELSTCNLSTHQEVFTSFRSIFYKNDYYRSVVAIKGRLGEPTSLDHEKCGAKALAWQIKINEDKDNKQLEGACIGAPIFDEKENFVFAVIIQRHDSKTGLAIHIEALKHLWPNMPLALITDPSTYEHTIFLTSLIEDLLQTTNNLKLEAETKSLFTNLINQIKRKNITLNNAKKEFITLYLVTLNFLHKKEEEVESNYRQLKSKLSLLNNNFIKPQADKIIHNITSKIRKDLESHFINITSVIISIINSADFSYWIVRRKDTKTRIIEEININIEKSYKKLLNQLSDQINQICRLELSDFESNYLEYISKELITKNENLDENKLQLIENLQYSQYSIREQILAILDKYDLIFAISSLETNLGTWLALILLAILGFSFPTEEVVKKRIISIYLQQIKEFNKSIISSVESNYLPKIKEIVHYLTANNFQSAETQLLNHNTYVIEQLNTQKEHLNQIKTKFEYIFGHFNT